MAGFEWCSFCRLQPAKRAPGPQIYVKLYNFSKEQYMLPQDDRVIETCRSVLGVLM